MSEQSSTGCANCSSGWQDITVVMYAASFPEDTRPWDTQPCVVTTTYPGMEDEDPEEDELVEALQAEVEFLRAQCRMFSEIILEMAKKK